MGRMGYRVSRKFAKEVVRATNRAAKRKSRELKKEKKNRAKALEQRVNERAYEKYIEDIHLLKAIHNKAALAVNWTAVYSLLDLKEEKYHEKIQQYSAPAIFKFIKLDRWHENRAFMEFDKMRLLSFEEIFGARNESCDCLNLVKVNQLIKDIRNQEKDKMIELYKICFPDEDTEYGIHKWDYQFTNDLLYICGYYSLGDFPERKRLRLDSGKIGNRKMSVSDRHKLIREHVRSASLWKAKSVLGLLPVDSVVVEVFETSDVESKIVSSWAMNADLYKEMKSSVVSESAVELAGTFVDDFRVREGYRPIRGYFECDTSNERAKNE